MNNTRKGFTLIELMITLAVLAIVVAIAIPSYQSYMMKTRRADAKLALTQAAQILERYHTNNNGSYVGATFGPPPVPGDLFIECCPPRRSDDPADTLQDYQLAFTVGPTAQTFTITATPIAGRRQEDDDFCTSFSIDQAGRRTATSNRDFDRCWE
jgi:type IV pilus assembly protein PilE